MSPVTSTLSRAEPTAAEQSPRARRTRRASWRDPRLAVGLLLVAGSVVTGAALLGGADDTTELLALGNGVAVGMEVEPADLVAVPIRFSSGSDADRYLPASEPLPDGTVLLRPVGVGELIPRDAVGSASTRGLVDVPVPVSAERMAAGVRSGALVDVWFSDGQGRAAERLLEQAPVRSVSRPAAGGLRQVVVSVPHDEQAVLAELVGHLDPQHVLVLLRRG